MKATGFTFILIILFGGLVTSVYGQQKSDFVRGGKIIFSDNFDNEKLGEFPSKWDLVTGNVEVYEFQNKRLVGFMGKADIRPYMKQKEYLPEAFTIEFDAYFHQKGNEAYLIFLGKAGSVTIRNYYALYNEHKGQTKTISKDPMWVHVAISFNKRALKVYMNDERVLNIPNVTTRPLSVYFGALMAAHTQGFPSVMDNVIIAEGAVPLYDKLMTDGKIVTNDIHFESGKAVLKPESIEIINQITALLKEHTEIKFSIEGHTDSDGNDADNQKLSEKRALAVKDAIVGKGIDAGRLSTKGYGESKPVADNTTDEGKAQNRRVEFVKVD